MWSVMASRATDINLDPGWGRALNPDMTPNSSKARMSTYPLMAALVIQINMATAMAWPSDSKLTTWDALSGTFMAYVMDTNIDSNCSKTMYIDMVLAMSPRPNIPLVLGSKQVTNISPFLTTFTY